jgi:hypothetical protein
MMLYRTPSIFEKPYHFGVEYHNFISNLEALNGSSNVSFSGADGSLRGDTYKYYVCKLSIADWSRCIISVDSVRKLTSPDACRNIKIQKL